MVIVVLMTNIISIKQNDVKASFCLMLMAFCNFPHPGRGVYPISAKLYPSGLGPKLVPTVTSVFDETPVLPHRDWIATESCSGSLPIKNLGVLEVLDYIKTEDA
jgi:hypothetical protein